MMLSSKQPSLTYKVDWVNHSIGSEINDSDAIKQAIDICLHTDRYEYPIYSWQYGNEIYTLFGKPYDFVESEIERMIKDALSVDDRITSVDDFTVEFDTHKKTIHVTFRVKALNFDENLELDINA